MRDCPSCYVRVLPNTDGTCPACSGVIGDEPAKWVRLAVVHQESLPERCAGCLASIVTFHEVEALRPGQSEYPLWIGVLLFVLRPFKVGAQVLDSWDRTHDDKRAVHIDVPLCATCSKQTVHQEAHHVDFDGGRTTILVCPEFRALVVEARAQHS